MEKPRAGAAKDFLVYLFIGDQVVSRPLSEILKNREDPLFLRALGVPKGFSFPFCEEQRDGNAVCVLRQKGSETYRAAENGAFLEERVIESGDYLSFSGGEGGTVKMLFLPLYQLKLRYRKYRIENNRNLFVGRCPENEIAYHFTDYVSREKHFAIHIDGEGRARVEDLKRSVGLYVNGRLTHSCELKMFDEIFLMGLSILYMGSFLAIRDFHMECALPEETSFTVKAPNGTAQEPGVFAMTPRILRSLETDLVEVDAPPHPQSGDDTPPILVMGPSITMSMVMLASLGVSIANALSGGNYYTLAASGTMAAGTLLGALLWPSLLRSYRRRRLEREEKYRKSRYLSYLEEIDKTLSAKAERSSRLYETVNPAPEELCALLGDPSRQLRLWERSAGDEDFLDVRVGLGSRPFQVQVKTPKTGFELYPDELRSLPGQLAEKYRTLTNVPLTLDLRRNRTVGIIGDRERVRSVLEEMILNVISLHACDEVKLVFVLPPWEEKRWEGYKNVPHLWSSDRTIRYFAVSREEAHFMFSAIDEDLKERRAEDDQPARQLPHYVLILLEPALVEKEALLRYLQDADEPIGLTAVFAYGSVTKLPKSCRAIVECDEIRTGYYIRNENANRFVPFAPDQVDSEKSRAFALALSKVPMRQDVRSLHIADRITFLQVFRAGNIADLAIEEKWDHNNSAKSLAAPIGVTAGGEPFSLDIHEAYHGCHGLVAGTTGSGKSEFLQAFILSLAIHFSPREITFVLVDFKGGDMARPFMKKEFSPALPHLAATISNLSGNILYRALMSLGAEVERRERLINQAAAQLGVDKLDINSYHKYYKTGRLTVPLPHLVIVIDEFAQLKMQRSDFLDQLVGIAQVGRSLGIHLILATQKPSGVVAPQIMSNSRFRICLKVADKQDSMEMLGKADAAYIKNPGRLYLQVGYDEIYECVQAGYSGADYSPTKRFVADEEITVEMTDHTALPVSSAKLDLSLKKTDKKQLEAVVAELVTLGQKKGLAAQPLWMDPLAKKILLSQLQKGSRGLCAAPVGLIDDVVRRDQRPLIVDFVKNGHLALFGASESGKTTFLHTLVYSLVCVSRYTPAEVSFYALDFGGRNLGYLEALPHVGGVVFAEEEEKLRRLLRLLHGLLDDRKRLFALSRCGTFSDYHAANRELPAVVVLIDNYASFREKYTDVAEELTEIIASGRAFGIYFVLTGATRNAIHYKTAEHIACRLCLRMNDAGIYQEILGVRSPVVPENIAGRGLTMLNRKETAEFQTALAVDGETEADRLSAICAQYAALAAQWTGFRPAGLTPPSPSTSAEKKEADRQPRIAVQKAREAPPPICESDDSLILGTSLSGTLQYGISLREEYRLCLCADGLQGLAGCFATVLGSLSRQKNGSVVLLDSEERAMAGLARRYSFCRYLSTVQEIDGWIEELKPDLNRRLEEEKARSSRLFILTGEFHRLFSMITDEQAAFLRKVVQYMNDPQYGVCFLCGLDVSREKSNDRLFLELAVRAGNYLFAPGNFGKALTRIEGLPLAPDMETSSAVVCLRGKIAEIRGDEP